MLSYGDYNEGGGGVTDVPRFFCGLEIECPIYNQYFTAWGQKLKAPGN